MTDEISKIPATSKLQQQQKLESKKLANRNLEIVSLEKDFEEWCESGFNPVNIRRNFKTLEEFKNKRAKAKDLEKEDAEVKVENLEKAEETSTRFQNKNFELQKKVLLLLRSLLKEGDPFEEILKKVLEFYPDLSLADEALDFLSETTTSKLKEEVLKAKESLNQKFEREIKAGKNIKAEAQKFSQKGLGSPTALRDLYRNITGTERSVQTLFNELSKLFNYTQLKTVIKFVFHSLGSDLNSKGPSISRAELLKLVDDTKSLQAILGIYRFFKGRMNLIQTSFSSEQLFIPLYLNFENLAKQFMKLLEIKYISPEKVIELAKFLGIEKDLLAQIIIFNQMRDATRNTAPKLYKNLKHREEVLESILEALESLEEKIEEEEEEEKEE